MSSKIMSIEELSKLHGSFIEATKTDEPVAIQTPTTSVVNGNPALSGSNDPKDYRITLYLPVTAQTPADAELVMDGNAYKQEITAKRKYITPRIARKVRNYASTIAISLIEFKEQGESDVYVAEDLLKVYSMMDDNVIDACENMVISVLGIPEHLAQYATDESLLATCSALIRNNPSFFQVD